jgi:hypothetical protein
MQDLIQRMGLMSSIILQFTFAGRKTLPLLFWVVVRRITNLLNHSSGLTYFD